MYLHKPRRTHLSEDEEAVYEEVGLYMHAVRIQLHTSEASTYRERETERDP